MGQKSLMAKLCAKGNAGKRKFKVFSNANMYFSRMFNEVKPGGKMKNKKANGWNDGMR